jgi:hypothetical protein
MFLVHVSLQTKFLGLREHIPLRNDPKQLLKEYMVNISPLFSKRGLPQFVRGITQTFL